MLVLQRKKGESIVITTPHGEKVIVSLVRAPESVRIGISAPKSFVIQRPEQIQRKTKAGA